MPDTTYALRYLEWNGWCPTCPPPFTLIEEVEFGSLTTNGQGSGTWAGWVNASVGDHVWEVIIRSPAEGTDLRTPPWEFMVFTVS